jgi:CheY-like chemotaxis protein
MNILLVEDDAPMRDVFQNLLQSLGHFTVSASNGQEALAVLQETNVDLVISDIEMPDLGGIGLACQLQEIRPTLPIILMSGGLARFKDKITGPNIKDAMEKPFRTERLKEAIQKATTPLS